MSATISRLILSIAMIAGTCILYLIMVVVGFEVGNFRDEDLIFGLATTVSTLTMAIGWVLIWRGEVRWSEARVLGTIGVFFGGFILAAPAAVLLWEPVDDSFALFIVGALWLIVWLVGTPLIWRETRRERLERLQQLGVGGVTCPACGYNLTGLREAKCPECGAQYTVDQLVASTMESRGELES